MHKLPGSYRFLAGFLILFTAFSLNGFCQQPGTYSTADMAALHLLTVKWEHYWNSHNMDSMGKLLSQKVDFVNVAGQWLRDRTAAVNDHKQKHLGIVFKNSVWITDSVDIRYVKPDLAILHIGWSIKGDNDPDGTPRKPRSGIFTWVVSKERKEWRLLAVHNVNIREPLSPSR
jgi:uncharacterized protein (TIGR02246 family)